MKKRVAILLSSFVLLSAGTLLLLPSFLSTSFGTRLTEKILERSLNGKIEVAHLSLSWFGSQKIEGVKITDPKANALLSIPQISSDASLFSIVFFHNFGHAEMQHPSCTLKGIPEKLSFVQKAQLTKASLAPLQIEIPFHFQGDLSLVEGECHLLTPTPFALSKINAKVVSDATSSLVFHLTGEAGSGNLLFEGSILPKIHSCQIDGTIQGLSMEGIDKLLESWNPEHQGLLLAAIGPSLDANVHLLWKEQTFSLNTTLHAQSLNVSFEAEGEKGAIHLKKPALIDWTASQQLFPSLDTPLTLHLEMQTLTCPFQNTLIDLSHLEAQGSVQAFLGLPLKGSFVIGQGLTTFTFANEKTTFQSPIPLEIAPWECFLTLKSLFPLQGEARIPSLILKESLGTMTLSQVVIPFDQAQTSFACTIDNAGSFQALFGNLMHATASWKEEVLSCQVDSPLLKLQGELLHQEKGFVLKNAHNQLSWILSPEGFSTLTHYLHPSEKAPFRLLESTHLTAAIKPLDQGFSLHIEDPLLHFINDVSKEEMTLSGLTLDCLQKENHSIHLSSKADVAQGHLKLEGTLPSPFSLEEISALCSLKQFPTASLDMLFHSLGGNSLPFQALFGKTLDSELSISIQKASGPFSLQVHSPKAHLSCVGSLQKGVLTLKEPLYLQGILSEEVTPLFLDRLHSLSISSLYSEGPIALHISQEDFSLPIFPLDLQKASAKGRLELGRLHCHNEGNVKTLLSILKSSYSQNGGDLPLWFAPLDFHLSSGVLNVERTEILLADSLDVAVWGNVNFLSNQVDMTLGITREALIKAFGIHNLPPNYVLTIPLKGKMDDIEVNSGTATTKIALLLAWDRKVLSEGFGTGAKGKLLEGLLGAIATLPDENANIPPPKHPFPWELEPRKKKTSETKPKKFKPKENGFKQLFKVLK